MDTFSTIFISESSNSVVKIEPLTDFGQQHIRNQAESTTKRAKVGEIYGGSEAGDELSFVCSICSAEFFDLAKFAVHIQAHLINLYSCGIQSKTINCSDDGISGKIYGGDCEDVNSFLTGPNIDDPIEANVEVKVEIIEDEPVRQPVAITKYKCSHCDRYLQKRAALTNHEKIHRKDPVKSEIFECFQCHLQFNTHYKCKLHIRTHRKLPFECEHCLMRFKSGKRHRELCGPWNRYKCQSCPMKFHNSSAMERHGALHSQSTLYMEYIPNIRKLSERQFTCRGCPFNTWNRPEIETHVNQCDEVKVRCNTCSKLVVKRILEHHMKLHTIETAAIDMVVEANEHRNVAGSTKVNADKNDGESDWSGHWSDVNTTEQTSDSKRDANETRKQKTVRKYKCSYCNKQVGAISSLVSHERSHFKDQVMPRSFECFICHVTTENRYRCQDHMRIHSDLPYKCQYCDMNFIEYKFRMHQKLCGPWNKQACQSCPMKFHNSSALTRHRKVHRQRLYTELIPNPEKPSERQFICKSCPFITNARDKMHSHRRVCVASERPCKVCGKLVKLHCMKTHLISHSDERDQLCLQCGKRYKNLYQLKIHMRSHSEERNFKCDLCQRPFKTANEVAMHRKRHFNQLTHICKMCSRSHRSNYLLKVHLKSAHSLEVDAKDAVAMAQYGYTKKCIDAAEII